MADGHRYMQQSFSTPLPTQFASNNNLATGLLLNSLLNQFIAGPSAAQQQTCAELSTCTLKSSTSWLCDLACLIASIGIHFSKGTSQMSSYLWNQLPGHHPDFHQN